ncbi:MAG TPA: type 1 glutamine amidotransferase family protein [Gemmatimonadales bacterium]|nr:type 1 glutamine amidotransferase family protein [Gemmatimonadales bacterium]
MNPLPHLFVFDGFADWEAAYAIAELGRNGKGPVTTVSHTGDPVVSMGGLSVLPDSDIADVDPESVRILILPGGDQWETEPLDESLQTLLRRLTAARTPIAAICAATLAVIRTGLLGGRKHTSNGLAYLKQHVPDYSAQADYVDAPAVRDRGLITAGGVGALEFAREIFAELGLFSAEDRAAWYRLHKGASA